MAAAVTAPAIDHGDRDPDHGAAPERRKAGRTGRGRLTVLLLDRLLVGGHSGGILANAQPGRSSAAARALLWALGRGYRSR